MWVKNEQGQLFNMNKCYSITVDHLGGGYAALVGRNERGQIMLATKVPYPIAMVLMDLLVKRLHQKLPVFDVHEEMVNFQTNLDEPVSEKT